MSKIVTITFSPCIDKSTSVPSLVPEKKLVCNSPKLEPGGGGINVARAIHKLGGEATAIFPSGGYTGQYFNHLLEQEEIPSVIIEAVNETRENIIVLDRSSNQQYRFGMPGSALGSEECDACLAALQSIRDVEFIVVSGSIPPGVPVDIFSKLSAIAEAKKAKLVVDVSGEALVNAFREHIYLLKPNLAELCTLAGLQKIDIKDVENVAMSLVQKSHCDIIVVSLGSAGAILATAYQSFRVSAPRVNRKSTVGAGDSMVAGIVLALSEGITLEQALQYGVACGTAATMNEGTQLCKAKDVDFLFEFIKGDFTTAMLPQYKNYIMAGRTSRCA